MKTATLLDKYLDGKLLPDQDDLVEPLLDGYLNNSLSLVKDNQLDDAFNGKLQPKSLTRSKNRVRDLSVSWKWSTDKGIRWHIIRPTTLEKK